ncbi:DUF805 domain-containing protein [Thiohalocapsa sp. ML1]|jgi:uncharacterized membrane protein YhaH (DUF805 family)|uniref:DUF805 domain-containing protein n=1 Tax=Thiohalocapsa sp. ML1 TaxID=1431688 RepID=UPI0007323D09|nr:DUF805 domain-containing protein [Thiohalocapsa sp. ML1]
MFNALWGDILRGRLQQLPFLGWYLVLVLIAMVLAFGIGAGIGAAGRMAGGEPLSDELAPVGSLGEIGVLAVSALFALLLLGQLNIMAKRLRDTGLSSAWLIVLGWLVLAGLLAPAGGGLLSGLLSLVMLAVLLLVPSDAFRPPARR